MVGFGTWTQINWYALGTLLVQLAFLIAAVWFARNFLNSMRAFQEQIGALLKLSIAEPAERHLGSTTSRSSLAQASPYWLTPSETGAAQEPVTEGPSRYALAWRHLVHWLQEPMSTTGLTHWRRVLRWLQTPAGS